MNNKMRKEIKAMIENEIWFYNANVEKYNRYKDSNSVRRDVASNMADKYFHSLHTLLKTVNLCDSIYDYSLQFESLDFYSVCSLKVEKVEG